MLSCEVWDAFVWTPGRMLGPLSWLSASLQPGHHGSEVADLAASGFVTESPEKWGVVEVGLYVVFIRELGWSLWGTPHSLAEHWDFSSTSSLISSQAQRLCTTELEIELKLSSDTNSQSDLEQDSGSYVHQKVGMGELCFL